MKKMITILLFITTICLGVLCFITIMLKDDTPPVITVPAEDMTYAEGSDTTALLSGVKAKDDNDGDVSNRVRIYDISPMEDGMTALVTYAAYDNSYNLGKATKIVNYAATEEIQEEADDTGEQTKSDDDTDNEEDETTEVTTEEVIEPGYEDPEMVSTGAPVIKLTTHEVKLPVGGYFYSMDYVENEIDDIDTKEYLYRNTYLEGEYDVNTPGEYELTYYCVDSNSNVSNFAKLKLIIGQ